MTTDLGHLPGVLRGDLVGYERPWRGTAGSALAVVRPSTLNEVREVVRWAVLNGVRLVPQGANTGLVGASVPDGSGGMVVLSTERLTTPIEIDPAERTAKVGAGTRLSTVNTTAAAFGLFLPIDLGADPTLGGMVSTNTGGARVVRYGPLRQQLAAIQAVAATADADVVGDGRALRKDSRGVDLNHVFVGAGGTLGVVTEVTVRLTARPTQTATWWVRPQPGREIELLQRLEREGDGLSAFEMLSAATVQWASRAVGARRFPFDINEIVDTAVLVEWVGADADSLRMAERWQSANAADLIDDAVEVPPEEGWAVRHGLADSLRTLGVVLGHDVAVPRQRIPQLRSEARHRLAGIAKRAVLCDFGHAGDGGLHLNVLFPQDVAPPSTHERQAIREAFDDMVSADGTYSAEHGLGPLNAARWRASTSPIEQAIIGSLKATLDPTGILGHPQHPYNLLGPS